MILDQAQVSVTVLTLLLPQIAAASLQNNSACSSDSTPPGDIREAQVS